jgi:hypothetical protein
MANKRPLQLPASAIVSDGWRQAWCCGALLLSPLVSVEGRIAVVMMAMDCPMCCGRASRDCEKETQRETSCVLHEASWETPVYSSDTLQK